MVDEDVYNVVYEAILFGRNFINIEVRDTNEIGQCFSPNSYRSLIPV